MTKVGIVVIGRNEGKRLDRCLSSLLPLDVPIVYVDSGSSDGSPAAARAHSVDVLELDPGRPFSAGRARNEGFDRLLGRRPDLDFVQFVDGDSEMSPEWLAEGRRLLEANDRHAAVCGRVRERARDSSVYNRLCDLEWDAPAGETDMCGGNAMYRVRAFREAEGFRPRLLAGEEPDLCFRLRDLGWKVYRSSADMVNHDADMTHFSQWWRRTRRGGWGYAQFAYRPGESPRFRLVHENLSIAAWGFLLPLVVLASAVPTGGASLVLLAAYPLLGARIYGHSRRRGRSAGDALLEASFNVLAKFPQALGQLQFAWFTLLGRTRGAVDWRGAA